MDEFARGRLLEELPVKQLRVDIAGVSTAVLEGGDGPPLFLYTEVSKWVGSSGGE